MARKSILQKHLDAQYAMGPYLPNGFQQARSRLIDVEGKFLLETTLADVPITYDPYAAGHFYEKAGRSAVYTAHAVSFNSSGALAFGINDY